ncbi:MAG: hypothetical protein V7L31_23055 [Nostoc sp.]|uniref:hypothetical protein n=1 Tax=Nostoc sp. TaxID=1180 RepID=UPI002FF13668
MTTDTQPVVQYAEMVGFLKGQRLAGIHVQCRLSADYSTVRAEYERLINAIPEEVVEAEIVDTTDALTLPQFTNITVLDFPSENTVELQLNDEVREVEVTWDKDTDSGVTVHKEVAVTIDRSSSHYINICKLEVFQVQGVYKAYPLSNEGGKVDWLYPSKNTKFTRVKAYLSLNSGWKWVDIDMGKSTPEVLVSEGIVICRESQSCVQGIQSHFPSTAILERVGGKWIVMDINPCTQWISIAQDVVKYQFKIGEVVYLQSELGQPVLAAFQIEKLYYSKLVLMAQLRCLVGNKTWHRDNTTVQPIVQLINVKRFHL